MWGEKAFSTDGGGYFDSSVVQSPATGASKRGLKRAQNIVPVMMKHLVDAPEELKIWGMDVQIITVVGIVRGIKPTTTKISYDIEDETGKMTAFQWLEADKSAQEPAIEVNTYVRVYGSLREQHQEKHILVMRMRPITNLNELTSHLLEVIYVALKGERLSDTGSSAMPDVQNTAPLFGMENSLMEPSILGASVGGMTNEQKEVFKIIQTDDSLSGIERDQIKKRVPQHIKSRVDDILDFLASEGHIYTTLTDDHFKTT